MLNIKGNGQWDGCCVDKCLGCFGTNGDLPVLGDWDGTGKISVGIFRCSRGMWYLEMNGIGNSNGCKINACVVPFGQAGDLPTVGKW